MHIIKCDLCQKVITDDSVRVTTKALFLGHEFCLSCGKPITDFLEKNGFSDKTITNSDI